MSTIEVPMKINVKTTIHQQGGKEVYELAVFGRYLEKDGASFLKYEEVQDEGSVRTIVKVAGDKALILRGGAVKMRLPFRLHKKLQAAMRCHLVPLRTMHAGQADRAFGRPD